MSVPRRSQPPARTILGGSANAPQSHNTPKELNAYRGKSKAQMTDALNAEQAGLIQRTPPIWGAFHGYDGSVPSDPLRAEAIQVAQPRGMVAVQNVKSGGNGWLTGKATPALRNLAAKAPRGRRTYICLDHEPENDAGFDPDRWRANVAAGCREIIDARGANPVIPTICVINYSLHPNNGKFAENELNLAPELAAAGVKLDQVVYTTDGYDTSPIEAAGAAKLYTAGAKGKPGVWPLLRSWGFPRVGVLEGGCKSYTAQDRGLAPAWIRNLGTVIDQHKPELWLWFNSGVGDRAGSEGWWLYGTETKRAWAELCARFA